MDPIYFAKPSEFRDWLDENHANMKELIVGFHKKSTGLPSMTWAESVDEALCYGWIDGIRRSVDAHRYTIRFTPRKRQSIWSAINVKRVEELTIDGRMRPAGIAAFELRREDRSRVYAFEQENIDLPHDLAAKFQNHPIAWWNFEKMPRSYRKTVVWWVISAKQDSTRQRRLSTLIEDSANGLKVKQLRRPGDRG